MPKNQQNLIRHRLRFDRFVTVVISPLRLPARDPAHRQHGIS
jgi:hypothetical protein